MPFVNAVVGASIAGLLWPFQSWPVAGLAVVSLLVAAIVLVVFRAVSNQRALAVSKRRMQAGLFELRLFQDDPVIVLRAAGGLCREQVTYLRRALAPLLVLALPLGLIASHLQAHYGYAGLRPGEPALVKVRLKASAIGDGGDACARLALTAPDGLRVDSPCVWTPSLREAAWRLRPTRDGAYDLRVTWDGGEAITKRVQVSPLIVARAAVRPPPTLWAQLLHPAEPPLPAAAVADAIELTYPPATIDVAGLPLHWIVLFLLFSTAFTLLCRSTFGVVI